MKPAYLPSVSAMWQKLCLSSSTLWSSILAQCLAPQQVQVTYLCDGNRDMYGAENSLCSEGSVNHSLLPGQGKETMSVRLVVLLVFQTQSKCCFMIKMNHCDMSHISSDLLCATCCWCCTECTEVKQ